MLKNKHKKTIKTFSALLAMILAVPIFSGCSSSSSNKYSVDLEIWGSFDDSNDLVTIFNAFQKADPFVRNINYKKIPIQSYETELIDALASGNGPDIFLVNNAWMPRYEDKVYPAPSPIMNEQTFRNNFVDVVADDFMGKSGEIYGAPLSVDSLALYYNKDIFNSVGITSPPSTWSELLDDTKKITLINDVSEIERAGVALGTADNINRSTDIIDLLLLQNGAQLPSRESVAFKPDFNIGKNVLDFYTQFSRFSSPVYSWNKRLHYSIDAFCEGDLGMMINYSWQIDTIKNKNAKLNFAVANVPQISSNQPVNYANYWSFVVNRSKQIVQTDDEQPINNDIRAFEAWQFLKFLTFKNSGIFTAINAKTGASKDYAVSIDPASAYLEKTGRPAARRDLIDKQKSDSTLGAFAYGNLIAESWYKKNSNQIENVWADVINSINAGDLTVDQAFRSANYRIEQINQN